MRATTSRYKVDDLKKYLQEQKDISNISQYLRKRTNTSMKTPPNPVKQVNEAPNNNDISNLGANFNVQ